MTATRCQRIAIEFQAWLDQLETGLADQDYDFCASISKLTEGLPYHSRLCPFCSNTDQLVFHSDYYDYYDQERQTSRIITTTVTPSLRYGININVSITPEDDSTLDLKDATCDGFRSHLAHKMFNQVETQ